ncbi:MAG: TlpA disulfide reductase family protein [Gemmatimonadota bacterium]|nr:TlpA disulfide reductase family protein [Gemmatimonadota bacterium]
MTLRRSVYLLLASLLVLAASIAGYRTGRAVADRDAGSAPAEGGTTQGDRLVARTSDWLEIPLPDQPFLSLDGDTVRLDVYRGRILLLNFWGTWCPPCLAEIPHLVRVQERLEEMGGTIVGPAIGSGTPEAIRAFMDAHRINYPVWIGSDEVAVRRFGVAGYPFTLLVDPDGVIRRTYLGPQTEETLMRDVEALAAGAAG